MPGPESLLAGLQQSAADLEALRPAVEAGEPWPLSADFGTGPEASWGPRELFAHVAEMLSYWLDQAERVVAAGTPEPVPFGRTANDPGRLSAIEQDRRLPVSELYARIARAVERYADALPRLSPNFGRRGRRPNGDELSVGELLERTVVAHFAGHVEQLREILAAAGWAGTGGGGVPPGPG